MTDIVEQAARVIGAGRLVLRDNGKWNNEKIAQALADAGLLRDPARTVPHRDEVAAAIAQGYEPENPTPNRHDYRAADAVLALMADQPTVAEVQAQALEEAAIDYRCELGENPANPGPGHAKTWLQHRAQEIREEQ